MPSPSLSLSTFIMFLTIHVYHPPTLYTFLWETYYNIVINKLILVHSGGNNNDYIDPCGCWLPVSQDWSVLVATTQHELKVKEIIYLQDGCVGGFQRYGFHHLVDTTRVA